MKRNLVTLAFFLFYTPLFACEYCFVAQHGYIYDINRTSIRVDSRYQAFNGMSRVSTNDQVNASYTSTFLSYSFSATSWGVTIAAPYIIRSQENTYKGSPAIHYHHLNRDTSAGFNANQIEKLSSSGLGDISILGRVVVYNGSNEEEETFSNIFLQGGIKTATGSIDARDQYGYLLHPHLQNGTGTANILAGMNGMIGNFRTSVAMNILAGFPLKTNNFYQESSALNFDITLRHRIIPADPGKDAMMLIGNAGVIGRVWGVEQYKSVDITDTGGNYLFGSAGVTFYPIPSLGIELQYQIPFHKNFYGNQLDERYRITSGVAYTL